MSKKKQKVNEDYKYYFDDSSSEEEERDNLNEFGIDEFNESIMSLKSLTDTSKSDRTLSFIAHELGLRILYSKQVAEIYYPLKLQYLTDSEVLSDEILKKCIKKAVIKTFEKHPTTDKNAVKNVIDKFNELMLKDKRKFIKAIFSNNLQAIIPYYNIVSLFKFKCKTIKLDDKDIQKIIKEIYHNIGVKLIYKPGELDKARIKVNSSVKINLKQLIIRENSSIKKNIAELLLKPTSNISLTTFIEKHCKGVKKQEFDNSGLFCNTLQKEFYKAIKAACFNEVYRKILTNSFTICLNQDSTMANFLAYLRLMNVSNRRVMKNLKDNDNCLEDDQEILSRSIMFPGLESAANEKQVIYTKSYSRSDIVEINKTANSGSYSGINKVIENIKINYEVDDKQIAKWIRQALKGEGLKIIESLNGFNSHNKNRLAGFINSLTYLLFGTEVVRNPGSLITNFMLLELIEAKKMTWDQAFEKQMMPMAIENAVPAARWMHKNYQTAINYSYDYTNENFSAENAQELNKLITLEANILSKWLLLKGIKLKEGIDQLKIINIIIENVSDWYGINIEATKLKAEIFNYYSFDDFELDDLYELNLNQLNILQNIFSQNEMLEYYECYQAIKKLYAEEIELTVIISFYEDSKQKLIDMSNDAVIEFLSNCNDEVDIEELSDLYDVDEDKFWALVRDRDNLMEEHSFKEISKLYDKLKEKYKGQYFGTSLYDKISSELNRYSGSSNSSISATDSNSLSSSDESSSNEIDTYYCNISYENPILNDPKIAELIKIARNTYGIDSINKLINIGLSQESFLKFQTLRRFVSDSYAIDFFMREKETNNVNKSSSYSEEILKSRLNQIKPSRCS
ncbi:MAG: hypothetical protein J0H68_05285 [Sphingobacteriia bacterium]|nr:hypothetical protein [Sphingobacteriia bacterium]